MGGEQAHALFSDLVYAVAPWALCTAIQLEVCVCVCVCVHAERTIRARLQEVEQRLTLGQAMIFRTCVALKHSKCVL